MDLVPAVVLGVVQGLTEFLPVSSSGHLVLGQHALGFSEPELLFDVCLHVGTLAAVFVVFWVQIWEAFLGFFVLCRHLWARLAGKAGASLPDDPGARLALWVILGSVPTAAIGLVIKKFADQAFTPVFASCMLLVTGLFLLATRKAPQPGKNMEAVTLKDALLIGLAQGMAVLPGISRSGATITAGLFRGLDRDLAARYSFVLSIPAILGALVLEAGDMTGGGPPATVLLAGGLAAAVTGFLALKVLLKVVHAGKLYWFAPYCLVLGAGSLAWLLLG